jgi:hypothetical protein
MVSRPASEGDETPSRKPLIKKKTDEEVKAAQYAHTHPGVNSAVHLTPYSRNNTPIISGIKQQLLSQPIEKKHETAEPSQPAENPFATTARPRKSVTEYLDYQYGKEKWRLPQDLKHEDIMKDWPREEDFEKLPCAICKNEALKITMKITMDTPPRNVCNRCAMELFKREAEQERQKSLNKK